MPKKRKPLFIAMLSMRCPLCRDGDMFANKSILPLSTCVKMNTNCPKCGERLIYETNNGAGINYALSMIVYFLNLLWYWPIFGLSYKDNSVYYFLVTTTVVTMLLQPWLMRISRVIYLYMFMASRKI